MGNRKVRPVSGSRLVDVAYSDPDPARAQRIATAFAAAFIASNLDKRFEANAYAKTFLEDQLKQLKLQSGGIRQGADELRGEGADRRFRDEKTSIAESNLASANAALGNLVIGAHQERAALEAGRPPPTRSTCRSCSPTSVIEGLREKRNQLVTEYEEKLETFKPSYPAMVQIKNKIAEIDRQLAIEVRTIKDSLKAAYENSVEPGSRDAKADRDLARPRCSTCRSAASSTTS